jgi:multidrug efflux pump subunit AcrA (membrane-fusion protein)
MMVNHQLQSGEETRGAEAAAKPASTVPAAAAAAAERTVAVTVAPIALREVQRSVGAVGTFYGFDELTVTAEVPGRVVQMFHEVGEIVQPGDVLRQIDPTDDELAVEEKRREIELDGTRIGLREYVPADKDFNPDNVQKLIDRVFKIDEVPRVISAKEEMENAALRLERAEKLVADRALAREAHTGRSKDLKVA